MSIFQPEPFGKYYLVDKLAVGGMAEIFKAKSFSHGGFEKLLVIKRILGHLSDNLEFIEMFIDEAKISVTLQHPNIVQIYDFGKLRDNYFIAMECVEGKDIKGILRKLAERRKLLPIEFAVYISHEMCKGLDYAHKKADSHGNPMSIIHRDISPSNILVSYSGEVKVADFGIARAENSLHETRAGVLKGKFEYMSPEQTRGIPLDPRSDVFATGIILHEMLTGRRLFKTKSEIQTLEKIKAVDIDPPSALNPNIPARLDEIVMKALARERDDRYADCKSMQADLLDFMYPATPDLTQESLEHFLFELFAEEVSEERSRLEESSREAHKLWENTPDLDLDNEQWDEADKTADGTLANRGGRIPMLAAAGGGATILGLLGVIAYLSFGPGVDPGQEIPQSPTSCVPDRGCMTLLVVDENGRPLPSSVNPIAYIDDVPIGQGNKVFYADIEPDVDVNIRVEADGYIQDTPYVWTFEAGRERVLPPLYLQKALPGQTRPMERRPTGVPAIVMFATDPSGAKIFINDRYQGKTPMRWSAGDPGKIYDVRYELDGYQAMSFEVSYPTTDKVLDVTKTLEESEDAAKPKANLLVNCAPSWGMVFIDDVKVAASTPFDGEIAPGRHVVKVQNPLSGGSDTTTVNLKDGQSKRIMLTCK